MDLIGHKEWNQIFNTDLSKIWQEERSELQTIAVLLGAAKLELQKVQLKIEDELGHLRRKFEEKDRLKKEIQRKTLYSLNTNIENTENEGIIVVKSKQNPNKKVSPNLNMESPDLFKPTESLVNTSDTIIDLSISEDEVPVTCSNSSNKSKYPSSSPSLNKSRKPYYRLKKKLSQDSEKKMKNAAKNIFQTPGKSDGDETFIDLQFDIKSKLPNKDNQNQISDKSKTIELLNEINDLMITPNKKQKISLPEPEPVIRGNARKVLMKGTTCKDCLNLYGPMDLSPDKLQKVIDQCSNHRYVHQSRDETMPGYWDLSFPDV